MEASGIPIDVPTLGELKRNWGHIKKQLILDVEAEHRFGVYQDSSWGDSRFAALLQRIGILEEWPRTESGLSQVDDDVFKTMATRYPVLQPLRELRSTLVHLRDLKLTVGSDGRNRCSLMAFRSKTGRNYSASSKFIFGASTWLRSLIKPEDNRAVAYIDWVSAEFGIAAALSGDVRMKSAYESGDVYMSFAIDAKAAPTGATKYSHPEVRELYTAGRLGGPVRAGSGQSCEDSWRSSLASPGAPQPPPSCLPPVLGVDRMGISDCGLWEDAGDGLPVADARHLAHEAKHHLELPDASAWRRNAALGVHVCH